MPLSEADFYIVGDALGRGYAEFTEGSVRLAVQLAASEGINLDGTYMAKTLDGMIRFVTRRSVQTGTHLLWQTYHRLAVQIAAPGCSRSVAVDRMMALPNQPLDADLEGCARSSMDE